MIVAWAVVLFSVSGAGAQEPTPDPEEQVMQVVHRLFDAMRASDSTALRGTFHPELERVASSFMREDGVAVVRYGDLDGFAESVAGAGPGDLDERLGEPEIRIDDNLATVITPYAFYFKEQLSHCGVNVFLIARSDGEWKIVGLADTRRRRDCEEWLQ